MFPYPEKPEEWQSAYTRDQAYNDSGKYAEFSSLALMAGFLIPLRLLCNTHCSSF